MTTFEEERLERMAKRFDKEMQEFAEKYPLDIGRLYDSYLKIRDQNMFSSEFRQGYLGAISDLIIIKQGHWGDGK